MFIFRFFLDFKRIFFFKAMIVNYCFYLNPHLLTVLYLFFNKTPPIKKNFHLFQVNVYPLELNRDNIVVVKRNTYESENNAR